MVEGKYGKTEYSEKNIFARGQYRQSIRTLDANIASDICFCPVSIQARYRPTFSVTAGYCSEMPVNAHGVSLQ